MKKTLSLLVFLLSSIVILAQSVEYQTFIYTSDDLADEIQNLCEERNSTRSYMGDLFNASKESVKGIASGYVTSFIDLGANAIGTLLTRNSRLKDEWEETVRSENIYTTKISTVSEMNDFYKETSFDGALDPKGMRFDGIGCLRKDGNDTVFYISCHIDRNKNQPYHKPFQIRVGPRHTDNLSHPFQFAQLYSGYSIFHLKNKKLLPFHNNKLTSSWMNEIVTITKRPRNWRIFIGNTCRFEPARTKMDFFSLRTERGKRLPNNKIRGESFIVPPFLYGLPWREWRIQNQLRYRRIQVIHGIKRKLAI